MLAIQRSLLFVPLLAAVAPANLQAAEIENVKFAEAYQVGESKLLLNNVALMRYKYVIKAFVAALYIEEGVAADRVMTDVTRRIEIEYFWALKGKDISEAADTVLAQNLTPAQLRDLLPRIKQMNALYRDVEPGDRYALTYFPGVGTQLTLNGKEQGVVPGADFAAAYFTIWLGREPMDVALRDELLRRR